MLDLHLEMSKLYFPDIYGVMVERFNAKRYKSVLHQRETWNLDGPTLHKIRKHRSIPEVRQALTKYENIRRSDPEVRAKVNAAQRERHILKAKLPQTCPQCKVEFTRTCKGRKTFCNPECNKAHNKAKNTVSAAP